MATIEAIEDLPDIRAISTTTTEAISVEIEVEAVETGTTTIVTTTGVDLEEATIDHRGCRTIVAAIRTIEAAEAESGKTPRVGLGFFS